MAISPAGSGSGMNAVRRIVTLAYLCTRIEDAVLGKSEYPFLCIHTQLVRDELRNVNALFEVDRVDMTMLHCVAKYLEDKVDIVRDLLAVGADPAIKTSTGKDAYKLALKAGNEGVAKLLAPLCQEEKRASE